MNAPLKHPLTANTAGEVSEDPPGAPTAAEPAMTGETPPAEVAATAAADAVTPEADPVETDDFDDDEGPVREDENIPSFEIPHFIVNLLKDAHLYILPGESFEDFRNLYYSLETEFVAKNLQEYSLILDYAMLVWETLRYRRMKVGIERNNRHAAVETMFRRLCNGKVPKDAGNDFFSDPVFQAQTRKDFEAAGFSSDAVEVEAFQRSVSSIAAVEKLIAGAQKRIATFTNDLEKRYAARLVRVERAALHALMESS
jgi:hypothetical protein